ncbi:Metastasis-associated protein MTA2 [Acipenser ruthenus]|uniref:Metastasis-associated protein MTA2 n=1 Tax=Acipenser ruthenus TaxID=7906 RepID=A0A444UY87_ACIRT|nr:Metastasis-associated protein MTA2 [Acipenser ruthenus]
MTRQEVQGLSPFTSSAGRAKLLAKNRQTFILQTTKLTRIARRVCRDLLQPRRAARRPYAPINSNTIKAECVIRLPKAPKLPLKVRATVRPTLATIVKELAIQAPLKLKAPRGTPTPINRNQLNQSRASTNILGVKRPFENVGGGLQYSANGRPFTSGMRTTSQSVIKRQKVNPGDAPNPVVFVATKDTRWILLPFYPQLPWKSLASIVQFYYMWKTTDRYIQQKRLKAAEADSKLKQVYIPTYTKPNPNQIMPVGSKPGVNGAAGFQKGLSCESCHNYVYFENSSSNPYLIRRIEELNKAPSHRYDGHGSHVTNVRFTHNDSHLISMGGKDTRDVKGGCKLLRNRFDSKDREWASYTCVLGFHVIGVWLEGSDGTDINALCRSHNERVVAVADDFCKVHLFQYPCPKPKAPSHRYDGHGSHVTNVRFTHNDSHLISMGGKDTSILQWRVVRVGLDRSRSVSSASTSSVETGSCG